MESLKNFLTFAPLNEALSQSLNESEGEQNWKVYIHAHSRLINNGDYTIKGDLNYIFIEDDDCRTDILHVSKEDLEKNTKELMKVIPSLTSAEIKNIAKTLTFHNSYDYGDGILTKV